MCTHAAYLSAHMLHIWETQGVHLCETACPPACHSTQWTAALCRGISLSFMSEKASCQNLEVSSMRAQLGLILGLCSCTPTSLAAISGWLGADNLLFTAWVLAVAWGELFHSHFVCYTSTYAIVHSPFIATEGCFFHFSICSHQKQITPWEAMGGRACPQSSPPFAGRGHYCLTFLLELSIPAVPSSDGCQLHLPSRSLSAISAPAPCFSSPRESSRGQRDLQHQIQSRVTLVKHWWASCPPGACHRHEASEPCPFTHQI